jgi:hypothetical protein
MILFEGTRTWIGARGDAKNGLDLKEEQFISHHGDRPVFSPATNLADGQMADKLHSADDKKEYQDDLERLEQERAKSGSVTLNLTYIAFCAVIEIVGANLTVKSLEYENPERLAYGLGLALLLFIVTHYLFNDQPPKNPSKSGIFFHYLSRTFVAFVYIAVAIAIAMIRRADDSGWAETIIITAATVGPAWMVTTTLWPRYEHSLAIRQEIRRTNKRIRRTERDEQTTTRFVERTAREQTSWDKDHAKHIAKYSATHQRTSARRKT